MGTVFWILFGAACGIGMAVVGLLCAAVMWSEGSWFGALVIAVVTFVVAGLVSLPIIGRDVDDRAQVCTVTDTDVELNDSNKVTRRIVSTRECGELEASTTAVFDELEVGRTYRLQISGGRWLSWSTVHRILPCEDVRCLR